MERLVQCLSPVHIGTGKNVEPFDYILEGSRYIRVNLDALVARLSETQAARLAEWVSERADRMATVTDNRELSELRRAFNMLSFARDHAVDLQQALLEDEELALYKGRGAPDRNLQLREQLKEADGTPLIPGSSVKGAIRTALAFAVLQEMGEDARQVLARELGRKLSEKSRRDQVGQEIEQAVFYCGKKNRQGRISYEDIHYDLMRVISVSDCQAERAELIVPQVYTFVEQRSREGQRTGKLTDQAPIIAEAHAPDNAFRLRINVDGKLLKTIQARRGQQGDEWIGFAERVRLVFGSQVAEMLGAADEEALKGAVLERIEMACRQFAQALIVEETRWAEQFTASRVLQFYERLKALGEEMVLLRLGWGSDFLSTTLLLALREDAAWREVLERCFRVFDIGLPPGRRPREGRGERSVSLDGFPTSRRLVAVNQRPVAPFGWVALQLLGAPPAPKLLDIEELIKQQSLSTQPRPSSPQRPRSDSAGGRRPPSRAEVPPRRPEPPVKMPPLPKPQPRPEPQTAGSSKIKKGDKISAEVLSNQGGVVRVRLIGASGEEISFSAYYPHQVGAKVKVKVDKVDTATGKVMKVIPA